MINQTRELLRCAFIQRTVAIAALNPIRNNNDSRTRRSGRLALLFCVAAIFLAGPRGGPTLASVNGALS